jgi:hypothetical protein
VLKTIKNKICWAYFFHLLIRVGVMVYVLSRFIPSKLADDYPMAEGLDEDWTQALHVAFAQHLQFGIDFVFTYGPWGFLARGYYPPTYLASVVAWAVLSMIFLRAGWRVARHFSANQWMAGLWLVALTATASIPVGDDFNTRVTAWCLLLLWLHFFVEPGRFTMIQFLLVVSLGWLSLVKFTCLVESATLIMFMAAEIIFCRRRFPWIIIIWGGSVLCFWVTASQHLSSLIPYLINSWHIAAGYTEAMMSGGSEEILHGVLFLLLAGLVCALIGRIAWARMRYFAVLPLAGVGVMLFFTFKLGFVRNGWQHEAASAMTLVLISLVCVSQTRLATKGLAGSALGCLALSGLFAAIIFNFWLPDNGLGKQLARTFSLNSLIAPLRAPMTGYLRDNYEKNLADLRKAYPLPPINGNIDLYSYDQNVLFAYGLKYQPRPIIQSYSAYTPGLAEMNAAHLRSPSAASNILFAVEVLDGRFHSLDDSLSWLELLTRYDLRGSTDEQCTYLLLTRSTAPRKFHLTPTFQTSARFGETVAVPTMSNGPVWVEIDFSKTMAGALISTFYKPPELRLTVSLQDHSQHCYRIIPGMTHTGFLLSPVILDTSCFAALAISGWPALRTLEVKSMTVSAATSLGFADCYEPSVAIRFYRLDFPLQTYPAQWPLPSAGN